MTNKTLGNLQPYRLASIQRTAPPAGARGSSWYFYEIAQGANFIHGYRQGSLKAVTMLVEENIALLNARQLGKCGNAHLKPNLKKKSSI